MNRTLPRIDEDMHVPITPARQKSLLRNIVPWALRRGLSRVGVVAGSAVDPSWLPELMAAVRSTPCPPELELLVGVEVEIAAEDGTLNVPPEARQADFLLVGDNVMPTSVGRLDALGLRDRIARGETSMLQVLREITDVYLAVMRRYPGLVLARPFSMLRRLGVSEQWIGEDTLRVVAQTAHETGCAVEVNERWQCPDALTLRVLVEEDVPLLFATETQLPSSVGRYDWALLATASLPGRRTDCRSSAGHLGSPSGLKAAS